MEDEPYSPTESTTTISNNQSAVTSTAHTESSDSDSETDSLDSDSDSSSSGEDSSDEEEEEKPKSTQNAKTKTSETNKRYEDEDDDIIILDHDEFKDDITTPEQLTIHVNCYVTRDILAKPDQSTHTRIRRFDIISPRYILC